MRDREHTVLLGRCREVNRGPPSAKPERTNSSGCSRGSDLPGMRCRSSRKDVGINAGSGDHLPGHIAQTAARRAFNAILHYAFGKRGRPKFRRRDRYNSFESKEAKSTIIWRDGAVRVAGRVIPAILDPANAWQSEALKAKTKYCRIIRRDIRGRARWYVQLVQEGLTPLLRETKRGVVGLDIGPSTIAAVVHTEAIFEQFCPSVIQPWEQLRRIERAMDRSTRANNPQCFDEKGCTAAHGVAHLRLSR
jgi:putative transposase